MVLTTQSAESIPRGAQRVRLLSIRMTAACTEPLVIRSIELQHSGMGDVRDIDRVYLMEYDLRLTRGRTFSSRNTTVRLPLRSFVIPVCEERSIDVAVDFAGDAAVGGNHRITIQSVRSIDSSPSIQSLTTGKSASSQLVGSPNPGTISVEYPALPSGQALYGRHRTVGRILLSANSLQDHRITAIVLTNEGSARDHDLENLSLENSSGDPLTAVVSSLDRDSVRFVFDPPLLLGKNENRLLLIKADVRASRRRTIQLEVEEPGDLESMPLR